MPLTRKSVRDGRNSRLPESIPDLPNNINPPVPEGTKGGKDFGRDKDIKNLLKTLQPKAFTGEGFDVPKDLEEWIMSMEDYFDLAGYNAVVQGIMDEPSYGGS